MFDLLTPAALSVSELNSIAKNLLENHLSGLWVAGELSNLTHAASGHYYFSLKDNHAQVRCALFKHTATRLSMPLKEGDHIELTGRIGIYEARGEFQITVSEVRHRGLGALYEAYERLKKQLQTEGVFDAERKRSLPMPPHTIGIVTSLAAAALRDVVSTLKRRAPNIPVVVYPTPVQGAGSPEQIAQAIHAAGKHGVADVLIVCRGGGSIEDLWSFNEEIVVRAIEACPIPVVSGVGHETDFTLADFVADQRAPTPTAAAELVSPSREDAQKRLNTMHSALYHAMLQRYQDASQRLDWHARQLKHPTQQLAEQKNQILFWQQQLRMAFSQISRHEHHRLTHAIRRLNDYRPNPALQTRQLNQLTNQFAETYQYTLQQAKRRLNEQQMLLNAVSPQQVLKRGFSVVQNTKGKVITASSELSAGQVLHIRFAEGEAVVRTEARNQPDLFDN